MQSCLITSKVVFLGVGGIFAFFFRPFSWTYAKRAVIERFVVLSQPLFDTIRRPSPSLSFGKPDLDRFPCLRLAYEAIERGGNAPCALNAANEVANLAFRKEEITYGQIAELISKAMQHITFIANPTLDDLFHTDGETRQWSSALITQ